MVVCVVGPAYPSVRILLTAEVNHNTCLGEITAGSARVFKGLCFIKTKVSVQAVTTTNTQTYVWQENECDACLYMVCVCARVCACVATAVWVISAWLIELQRERDVNVISSLYMENKWQSQPYSSLGSSLPPLVNEFKAARELSKTLHPPPSFGSLHW